jgi:LacI family transcriptional regulator
MSKKASIKDIAEAVGVSTALVSYVLNNREREARVSPETAKKVRKTAKRLNYQPNQVAKTLKSGRSLAIGLIVADISNPFFGHLARTIEDRSEKAGYTVIFASSDENAESSNKLMKALINRQIDGFIIAPAEGTQAQLQYLKASNIPFVLIDRYFEEINSSYVISDNLNATFKATKELLRNGHKKIGFVRYKNELQHTQDRYNGYVNALKSEKRKDYEKYVCEVDYNDPEDFKYQVKKIIGAKNKIDAVLFSTNTLSIMGLKLLIDLNIKVPDDLAVFCFDESESYDLFYCPVSYVKQPMKEIGEKAVEILLNQLSNRKKINFSKEVLPTELILAQSSLKIEKGIKEK